MPPHGGCAGHFHDEEPGDEIGLSLRQHIDFDGVICLNEEVAGTGKAILKLHEERLTLDPYLLSTEDDPELLLTVPFTEAVSIQSIAVWGCLNETNNAATSSSTAPPRKIRLFSNRQDMDFESAREMPADMELELVHPSHNVDLDYEGTIDYPLRPAGRFQNITSLSMFVESNYDDDEVSTRINFVGFKGDGTNVKRKAVKTVYESQANLKDHKVPGAEHGNSSFV